MIARLWQGARAIAPFVVEWGLAKPVVVGWDGFKGLIVSSFQFFTSQNIDRTTLNRYGRLSRRCLHFNFGGFAGDCGLFCAASGD
jgi:hypothetical protein